MSRIDIQLARQSTWHISVRMRCSYHNRQATTISRSCARIHHDVVGGSLVRSKVASEINVQQLQRRTEASSGRSWHFLL
jgi:hypothetical protein